MLLIQQVRRNGQFGAEDADRRWVADIARLHRLPGAGILYHNDRGMLHAVFEWIEA